MDGLTRSFWRLCGLLGRLVGAPPRQSGHSGELAVIHLVTLIPISLIEAASFPVVPLEELIVFSDSDHAPVRRYQAQVSPARAAARKSIDSTPGTLDICLASRRYWASSRFPVSRTMPFSTSTSTSESWAGPRTSLLIL